MFDQKPICKVNLSGSRPANRQTFAATLQRQRQQRELQKRRLDAAIKIQSFIRATLQRQCLYSRSLEHHSKEPSLAKLLLICYLKSPFLRRLLRVLYAGDTPKLQSLSSTPQYFALLRWLGAQNGDFERAVSIFIAQQSTFLPAHSKGNSNNEVVDRAIEVDGTENFGVRLYSSLSFVLGLRVWLEESGDVRRSGVRVLFEQLLSLSYNKDSVHYLAILRNLKLWRICKELKFPLGVGSSCLSLSLLEDGSHLAEALRLLALHLKSQNLTISFIQKMNLKSSGNSLGFPLMQRTPDPSLALQSLLESLNEVTKDTETLPAFFVALHHLVTNAAKGTSGSSKFFSASLEKLTDSSTLGRVAEALAVCLKSTPDPLPILFAVCDTFLPLAPAPSLEGILVTIGNSDFQGAHLLNPSLEKALAQAAAEEDDEPRGAGLDTSERQSYSRSGAESDQESELSSSLISSDADQMSEDGVGSLEDKRLSFAQFLNEIWKQPHGNCLHSLKILKGLAPVLRPALEEWLLSHIATQRQKVSSGVTSALVNDDEIVLFNYRRTPAPPTLFPNVPSFLAWLALSLDYHLRHEKTFTNLEKISDLVSLLNRCAVSLINVRTPDPLPLPLLNPTSRRLMNSRPPSLFQFMSLAPRTLRLPRSVLVLTRCLRDLHRLHKDSLSKNDIWTVDSTLIRPTAQMLSHFDLASQYSHNKPPRLADLSMTTLNARKTVALLLTELPHTLNLSQRSLLLQFLVIDEQWFRSPNSLFYNPFAVRQNDWKLPVRRNRIVWDTLEALQHGHCGSWKDSIRVTFLDDLGTEEAGVDAGGLFREYMILLARNLFSSEFKLFKAAADFSLVPDPLASTLYGNVTASLLYHLAGIVVGKALYENLTLEAVLNRSFLNRVQNRETFHFEDLSFLDSDLYKQLKVIQNMDDDVSELQLTFSIDRGSDEFPLVPNGKVIPVTNSNKEMYISKVVHFKLVEDFSNEAKSVRDGISSVIPLQYLSLFDSNELSILVSGGDQSLDIFDLAQHSNFTGGYHKDAATIKSLWKVLGSFTVTQCKQFLMFVTSCPRPPFLGFRMLQPRMTIHRIDMSDQLPSAATCINQLNLPDYGHNTSLLKKKLTLAIEETHGFHLN